MNANAVILDAPRQLSLRPLTLSPCGPEDVVVHIRWSGISTGTEKLLWTGEMPRFPGFGYPLVPGYESVGLVVDAGGEAQDRIGDWVFVPGATCYEDAKGLFGGTAEKVIVPSTRALPVDESLGQHGVLFALAATALHAIAGEKPPELIVGHGTLGRLLARLTIATGHPAPVVWDNKAERRTGGVGYEVIAPKDDDRHDYGAVYDASGYADGFDTLIGRLAHGGELVLAGFYANRPSFAFPPAFMKEMRLRVAAEWQPQDLAATSDLITSGALDLSDLISHTSPAGDAAKAYPTAFHDTGCLKMVLDWSEAA